MDFDKKCESLDKCTSDIELNVEMFLLSDGESEQISNNTTLFVGAANELLV